MSYKVYTTESQGQRNHISIFVETETDGRGRTFHVIGTILNGMEYQTREDGDPIHSPDHVAGSKTLVGTIEKTDMSRFEAVCEAVEVPGSQVFLNGKRKDPSKPLRRCGDWVKDVKAKLVADGILATESA